MDRSSFYRKNAPQGIRSRGLVWSAVASVFFLMGHVSSLGNQQYPTSSGVASKSAMLLPTSGVLTDVSLRFPFVDTKNLAVRFAKSLADLNFPLPAKASSPAIPVSQPVAPMVGLIADDDAKRRQAAYSTIGVFSFADMPAEAAFAPGGERPQPSLTVEPRSDLLDGVPGAYAALAVRIAAEEEVDPNWVLTIMHAENAAFDRRLTSPAGAVGLMQVMPQIGMAFGVSELTDPEQNIRAGTRFLHLLIGKYRNPVLIASAYNAGEPRVDANLSLPLIQETADYVTRVVGYYTGMPAAVATKRPQAGTSPAGHRGRADRAKSPMLVFSVAEPSAALGPAPQEPGPIVAGDPMKIVNEEVIP